MWDCTDYVYMYICTHMSNKVRRLLRILVIIILLTPFYYSNLEHPLVHFRPTRLVYK